MLNSNSSIKFNLENPYLQFMLGLILSFLIWIVWGLSFDQVIGTNDISHHLLTLKIGSQRFPHFTPIYDWLWMGGQLVAPNVGHVPIERFILLLGGSEGFALTFTILIFHASIFTFSFELFDKLSNWGKPTSIILSIAIAFLPSTVTRIFFGHTSLYFPIAFLFFLIWLLNTNRFHWFYYFIGITFGIVTLSGPSFQLVFYFIFFIMPFLLILDFEKFKTRWVHLLFSIILSVFLSLDFVFLIYNYVFKSGDMFRSSDNKLLLFSYAKLNFNHFFDFFSLKILNINNDNYFLFHETKYFLGLSAIWCLFKSISKKHFFFLFSFLILIFVLIIPISSSLEIFLSNIPGFNMFRIPQRVFLLLSPLLIFYSLFLLKAKSVLEKHGFWIAIFIVSLLSYFLSLLWIDIFLVLFFILYTVDLKISPSSNQLSVLFLISIIIYGFQFNPRTTSSDMFLADSNYQSSIKRSNILNSKAWAINTNRFYNINSAFGYTHPLPRFRTIYQETFNHQEVDQLFFSPRKSESLKSYMNFFRYHKPTLSFSPFDLKNDLPVFENLLKSGAFDPEKVSFVSDNQFKICKTPLKILSENIIEGNLTLKILNNNSFECLLVIPFNFSSFLKAHSENNKINLLPVNYSQIGLNVPVNESTITLGPNYLLYWKVKVLGFILAFFCFLIYRKAIFPKFNNF